MLQPMEIPFPQTPKSIVNSVTEDEDDDDRKRLKDNNRYLHPGETTPQPLPSSSFLAYRANEMEFAFPFGGSTDGILKRNSSTLPVQLNVSPSPVLESSSYFFRYQRMVTEQELELSTTLSHVQPLLELLQGIIKYRRLDVPNRRNVEAFSLLHEISVQDLHYALGVLETHDGHEVAKTDKQFMMTLRILSGEEESFLRTKESSYNAHKTNDKMISMVEFLQCYRMCIVGMQTLELLPFGSTVRKRTKQRTLDLLSHFRPTQRCKGDSVDSQCLASLQFHEKSTNVKYNRCTDQIFVNQNQRREEFHCARFIAWFGAFFFVVCGICMFQQLRRLERTSDVNPTIFSILYPSEKILAPILPTVKLGLNDTFSSCDISTGLARQLRFKQTYRPTTLHRLAPLKRLRTIKAISYSTQPDPILMAADEVSTIPDHVRTSCRKILMKNAGGVTALLYLTLPIFTANPIIFMSSAATLFLGTPFGRTIRSWLRMHAKTLGLHPLFRKHTNQQKV